jgi:hypothetical protein
MSYLIALFIWCVSIVSTPSLQLKKPTIWRRIIPEFKLSTHLLAFSILAFVVLVLLPKLAPKWWWRFRERNGGLEDEGYLGGRQNEGTGMVGAAAEEDEKPTHNYACS